LDQWPPQTITEALLVRCLALPGVVERPTSLAVAGTRALWLPPALTDGPEEATLTDGEFAHVHPPPESALHLTLPVAILHEACAKGWAEPHPMVRAGILPPTIVLVYAPRDPAEAETVFTLVETSYWFARGQRLAPQSRTHDTN
jgi:phospholipase/carboxylesterase